MENVCSAVPLGDSTNCLSAKEFQNMLSSWFEEKGVLADLRSQLRFKMVNALKNTVIGRDIGKRTVQQGSLSKQAVNLIVAEFLMQNKFHYSLSVFNTEACLTNILPESPIIFENITTKKNEIGHFDKENILNIMELIGIAKTSVYCEELLGLYFSSQENNSILLCLISLLCKLADKYDRKTSNHDLEAELIDPQECTFIKEVGNILLRSDLSTKNLKMVLENIKSLYITKKQTLEKEHSKLTNELKTKIKSQESQIKEMQKVNKVLENHFGKINKEHRKLKLHVKNLISHREMLKQSYEKPNKNVKDFSKTVHNNLKENKSISNSSVLLKNQNILVCHLPHCTEICEANIRRVEELSKENKLLDEENEEQKEKIKKLSNKYRKLINEFVDCRSKINLINSRINEGNTKELINNFLQEDNLTVPEGHAEKNVESSDTSSNSVTELILLQARSRLQKLEEESNEIEEKFKNLHYGIHTFEF